MKNMNEWSNNLVITVNSLQRSCYQLRFLEAQMSDLCSEWLLTKEDKDSLAEMMVPSVTITTLQLYQTLILEKNSLIEMINTQFAKNIQTQDFKLLPVDNAVHRIEVHGGIENLVKINFVGCGSFENTQEISAQSLEQHIFLGERDLNELSPASGELQGEIWNIDGDQDLGSIFWPFLMPLDATCFCINAPYSLVLDVEGSEK